MITRHPCHRTPQIIPASVTWGGQAGAVFGQLSGDFMKPVATGADSVDALLKDGRLLVAVYTGQLDLICCTMGTEAWLRTLTWAGMADFRKSSKTPLYPSQAGSPAYNLAVYRKASGPLRMYYVNLAGHMVPSDNPDGAMVMLKDILAAAR